MTAAEFDEALANHRRLHRVVRREFEVQAKQDAGWAEMITGVWYRRMRAFTLEAARAGSEAMVVHPPKAFDGHLGAWIAACRDQDDSRDRPVMATSCSYCDQLGWVYIVEQHVPPYGGPAVRRTAAVLCVCEAADEVERKIRPGKGKAVVRYRPGIDLTEVEDLDGRAREVAKAGGTQALVEAGMRARRAFVDELIAGAEEDRSNGSGDEADRGRAGVVWPDARATGASGARSGPPDAEHLPAVDGPAADGGAGAGKTDHGDAESAAADCPF